MKHLSGNIRAPISSLTSLERFVATGGTFDHKVEQIKTIIGDFPDRKFILIGDSGECDPEVYREVENSALGSKIQEIIIRDVVNARVRAPQRLKGMTILEATTVVDGGPQPDCGPGSSTR
jgi:phosphatidate phosphatase APP1